MTWIWPLKNATPLFPDEPGTFGSVRIEDVHTGVDLYCELGTEVVAVEDGEVILVEGFTGPNAPDPSPWWNDTDAVLVRGPSGVVTYGEITSLVSKGDKVRAGAVIGRVDAGVLKAFKGRPMVMLHLELLTPEATGTVWWRLNEPQPVVILDPTPKLREACQSQFLVFNLATYDGTKYRDPKAPEKLSRWWSVWGGSPRDMEAMEAT